MWRTSPVTGHLCTVAALFGFSAVLASVIDPARLDGRTTVSAEPGRKPALVAVRALRHEVRSTRLDVDVLARRADSPALFDLLNVGLLDFAVEDAVGGHWIVRDARTALNASSLHRHFCESQTER